MSLTEYMPTDDQSKAVLFLQFARCGHERAVADWGGRANSRSRARLSEWDGCVSRVG